MIQQSDSVSLYLGEIMFMCLNYGTAVVLPTVFFSISFIATAAIQEILNCFCKCGN